MGKYNASVEVSVDVDIESALSNLTTSEQMELFVDFFDNDLPDELQEEMLEKCYDLLAEDDQCAWLVSQFGRFLDDSQQEMIADMFDRLSRYSVQVSLEKIVSKLDSMQKQELRKLLED